MSTDRMPPLLGTGQDDCRPVRRRFALEVGTGPDVLLRVLVMLRRRQCRVVAVHFQDADRHRPGRFELTVLAPARTGHRVEAWLEGLVDVHAIETGAPTARGVHFQPALGA